MPAQTLFRHTPSERLRRRLTACGFDLDDPDKRHPVGNPLAERLAPASPGKKPRSGWRVAAGALGVVIAFTALPALACPSLEPACDGWRASEIIEGGRPFPTPPMAAPAAAIPAPAFPWILVMAGAILAIVAAQLIALRRLAWLLSRIDSNDPDPEPSATSLHVAVDAATRCGRVREENQDAVAAEILAPHCAVLIVCDGVGGRPGGAEAAQTAVDEILISLKDAAQTAPLDGPASLEQAIQAASARFQREGVEGLTTAVVAGIAGDRLHYATLGDGALSLIWPDGMVQQLLAPHHALGKPANLITTCLGRRLTAPARTGSIRLEPGSLILAMSDGAADLLPFEDLAHGRAATRRRLLKGDRIAEAFLQDLEEARDEDGDWLHSDNLTLAIAAVDAEEPSHAGE